MNCLWAIFSSLHGSYKLFIAFIIAIIPADDYEKVASGATWDLSIKCAKYRCAQATITEGIIWPVS